MKKRSVRLLSLLLAIIMIAGLLEAPIGLLTVNAADDTTTPSIPDATKYYVNNDFETDGDLSDFSLLPKGDSNAAEVRKANSYIYMEKNTESDPRISRDLTDVADASCIVVEVKLASTKLSGAALELTGTAPEAAEGEDPAQPQTLDFVSIDADGKILYFGNDSGKTIAADGSFVTVTVAVDSDANTYSLWIDGVQIAHSKQISAEAFGKVSAMAIELNGDVTNAANLMVDDLKVYSWTAVPTSYYDNDFNTNADGFTFATSFASVNAKQYSEHKLDTETGEGYIYLRSHSNNNAVAWWNNVEDAVTLSDQFVVSFDHAALSGYSTFWLSLVDEEGDKINVLWTQGYNYHKYVYLKDDGTTGYSSGYSLPVSTDSMVWRNVTLAFDMTTKTYSLWGENKDGTGTNEYLDLKLADPNNKFGTVKYIEFISRGDDTTEEGSVPKNYCIDNFTVYAGTEPRDSSVEAADPTVIPSAVESYIDDSFDEAVQTAELVFDAGDTGNKVEIPEANHYVYLGLAGTSGDPQIYKNFGETIDSDYVVVSVDIASTHFHAARFYFNGSTLGPNFRYENDVYKVFWGSSDVMNSGRYTTEADGEFSNVTVVFDYKAGTYEYWFNGAMIKNGTWSAGKLSTFKISLHNAEQNLMIDNLKIYSYEQESEEPGPSESVPETTGPDETVPETTGPDETVPETTGPNETEPDSTEPPADIKVYYNNDFNENADGITFASVSGNSINYSEHKLESGEGYLYLRGHNYNNAVAYWNKGEDGKAILELPDQFVISFERTALSTWCESSRLYLVDEDGDKLEILWQQNGGLKHVYLNDAGEAVYATGFSLPASTDTMNWRTVTLAFDMTEKTYSFWCDNYNNNGTNTYLDVKLPDAEGTFGKVQYIEFTSRGDDTTQEGSVPKNICLDDLKIYEGTEPVENVGAQNQFPPEPEPADPIKVWYNNDFNENADGITFVGSSDGKHVLTGGEGYLYLRRVGDTKVAFWNRGTDGQARAPLTDQFVISFDVSSTALANGNISIVDEKGEMINVVNLDNRWNYLRVYNTYDKEGVWTTGLTNICWNGDDGRTHKLAVAIDTTAGTFSVWLNGNKALSDLYLNDDDFSFGTAQYVVFSANDPSVGASDDGVAQYIQIDNLKIYEGTAPVEEVGEVTETPTLPEDSGLTPPVVVDPEDVGDGVYYNNDFSANADGIYLSNDASSIPVNDRINIAKYQDGHLYLWRTESGQPSAYWNRADSTTGKLKLSDYVVVSFDLSTTSLGPSYIQLIGADGVKRSVAYLENGRIRFYRINDAGSSTYAVYEGTIANDGQPVHIDLAINSKDCVYSAWVNGEKLFSNERFTTAETFGKLQYVRWYVHNSCYNEDESVIPTDLMLDNLQVYDGIEPKDPATVGEVNVKYEFPRPEGVDPGNGLYYESDLEDKSKEELTLMGGSEIKQEASGNHSIAINLGAGFLWNYNRKWEPGEYLVYEVSVATSTMGTLLFKPVNTEGSSFYPVKIRKTFELTPSHAATEQKLKNGEWVNIAVAINGVDNTYSVWYDGEAVAVNLKIPVENFGQVGYIAFSLTDGEMATTEWRVDNIKVYQGFCPDDYANTVQLTEQPKDETYLEEWLGEESRLLDYATEELAIIDAAGAVMVNTDTLYIYQNGQRTQGTQAQVDALLASASGKTVIKNDLGLVIISGTALTLSDDQIASLHDYMLYTRPSADTLKSLFSSVNGGEHPRIILNQDKIDQIRSDYKSNDLVKEWADALINKANLRLKSKHVEFSDASFTRSFRDNWPTLAMAYLLTGDTKYKDWLWEDIKGAAEFPNWGHTSYLNIGDASYGIAVAYDWLYDVWTPEQRKVMEEAIYEHILYYHHKMTYGFASGTSTYIASDTNRNAVVNGGAGMACIAVFDVYPEKVADIMEKGYHFLEIMLSTFAPDGANTEGPAYWEYLMRYLAPFMQSTLYTFGDDFNIFDAPGFATTTDFYLDIDGMTGVNNLHDAVADNHGVAGEVFCLSNMLGRPDLTQALLAKMDVYGLNDGIWSLMYYDTSIKYDGTVDRALDAYYRGLEFVSMRSSWLNSAGIYASLHSGGHSGQSHDHVDVGSFVLDIGGQRFASDYGKESYDLKANGTYRHYYYRIRPEGHNVFVINPDTTGNDIGMNLETETISTFVSKSRGAYTVVSMNKAYAGYAQSAARGMMLGDDRKSVLIRDEIRGMTNDTNEVWWFMQMEDVTVTVTDDGKGAILSKGGVDVHMQVVSNAQSWEIKVLDTKEMYPLEGLPDQDKQTPNTNYSRLAIVFKTGKDVDINVKFAEVGDPKGDTPINDVALANWSIPDGILVADPKLDGIEIGGVEVPDFNKNQTFYNFQLPCGTTECPDVKVIGGEGCDIVIKKPKSLPGYLNITVTSKADSTSQTKYKLYLTVSGPISVEVSDTPEAENRGTNMLDGDLTTKWAVTGAGWAKFTFPEPQMVDAIWLCAMEMTRRVQPFSIYVSEDGVNFTKVWEGTTELLPEGSRDQLQEFKIPEGNYKAIRIDVTGAQYPDGRQYSWTSIMEVAFYYQGKPIEIILQTSDGDVTGNPNDNVIGGGSTGGSTGGDSTGGDATGPADPNASQPGTDVDPTDDGGNTGWIAWVIGGVAAALIAGGVILFIILKKKKKEEPAGEQEQEAVENDSVQ